MITQAENHLSDRGIFKKLIQKAKKIEKENDILSVSIFAMQPWLDVKEAGWSITIVTNKKIVKAKLVKISDTNTSTSVNPFELLEDRFIN